jgi:CxxC-x17-CxxC domain-containing protein
MTDSNLAPPHDAGESLSSSDYLHTGVCRAYADLLRRQRSASSTFVLWQKETNRSHEFVWLSGAVDGEKLMRTGHQLRIGRESPLFEVVQKMHATAELNPYEREILYGYPYVIGRFDGRPIRAPLFTIPIAIQADGSGFIIRPDDDVVRFNTLPFTVETDTAARQLALMRLLEKTPMFPLGAAGATDFATEISRELPTVLLTASLDGRLSAPPPMPNSGSYLEVVDQAAVFVAPKTDYFLAADLEQISGLTAESFADTALGSLMAGTGAQPQADFDANAQDEARIFFPFLSNRAQRRVALLIDHPATRLVRVEGPPGTGKSLTIANLACHVAATGRTVLITSQKDKALRVVDEMLRQLGLDQIPMTLLRHDAASRRELRDRLDRIRKERSAKEVEDEVAACADQFAAQKEAYLDLQDEFAAAVAAEQEYESAEHALEAIRGFRRIAASWRFGRVRGRLARRVSRATDELGEQATDLREALLEDALSVLKTGLEHLTCTAQRNQRQQIREFSKLLRRDQTSYRNFSIFDRLKAQPERAEMLLRLLPIWIVAPDDVARLFPCRPGVFDVVIVDEASQVDLPSITPILFRGNKVAIFGDPKQMQPRRFAFTQHQIATEAWHRHGMEGLDPERWLDPRKQSLLDLAFIRAEEELLLDEHFRCLPPIINFSNDRWYGGNLRIMTDESRKQFGDPKQPIIELHHVKDGVISNNSQENEVEARALVAKLKEMLTHPAYAEATFGVMCLFEEQVRLVQELVVDQIEPTLWEAHDLVAVNPDGFQGDERDVILYSLSYDNRIMNRSALSARQQDSEHVQGMLNVAFTRARDEIHIFHSAPIEDFTFADGKPGAITDWLAHCMRMQKIPRLQRRAGRRGRADSQFEANVADALRQRGYSVTNNYPACGFFIDLVVEQKGQRLAVECDGETFHLDEHGQLKYEDLERQAVLERAGWDVLRIPYRRWRGQPEIQLARIIAWFDDSSEENDKGETEDAPKGGGRTKDLRIAVSPHEKVILDGLNEGLSEEDELFRRCRDLLGLGRLGNRVRDTLEGAAHALERRRLVAIEDGEYFLTTDGRRAEPYVTATATVEQASSVRRRQYSRPRRAPQARQFYSITCSSCGRRAEIPIRPIPGRPMYCLSCYWRRKSGRR